MKGYEIVSQEFTPIMTGCWAKNKETDFLFSTVYRGGGSFDGLNFHDFMVCQKTRKFPHKFCC